MSKSSQAVSATRSGMSSSAEQRKAYIQVDLLAIPLVVLLFAGIFSFHFALLVGDWDYWVDWRDRRWWPLVTPLAITVLPAVFSYVLWDKLRLPLGGTLTILCLTFAAWISRYLNFHLFADFPMNFVWPSTYIGLGLILDCMLLLTRSFFWTGLFGGFAVGAFLYPLNWSMLASQTRWATNTSVQQSRSTFGSLKSPRFALSGKL